MRFVIGLIALSLVLAGCKKAACSTNADCGSHWVCTSVGTCQPGADLSVPSVNGVIVVAETTVQGHPEQGRGGLVAVDFAPVADTAALERVDDRDPFGQGCVGSVWAANYPAGPAGADEGTVTVTGTTGAVPPCAFVPGQGYGCVAVSGAARVTVLAAADSGGAVPSGQARLTFAGATLPADAAGRALTLAGAPTSGNNARQAAPLAIVSVDPAAGTLVVVNAAAHSEGPFDATYAVLAGAGPSPGGPVFLTDTDAVTVTLDPGGAGDITAFRTAPITPGQVFTLDTTSAATLAAIPTDGSGFQLSCDAANGGCGSATGTALRIVTTDTVPADAAHVSSLAPATSRVAVLSCAAAGNTLSVSPDASLLLHDAAPKVIEAVVVRANLVQQVNPSSPPNIAGVAVGRAAAGYTVVP